MPWDDWDFYERRPPRKVVNGIKARTQRGAFGKSWWAGRWIAALERLVDAGRISRGRSYARSGQVVSLDVDASGVRAQVQGSAARPYKVDMRFKTLGDGEWEQVIAAMAARALYAARLLSGEMPNEIEEVFEAAGVSLFPQTARDLETSCSCPDYANPCKHVAAVHYLLGERFDEDPFLIFALRGRTKEQIVEALRGERTRSVPVPSLTAEEESAAAPAEPLAGDPATFWTLSAALDDLHLSFAAPPVSALALKQRGRPDFWDGSLDFMATVDQAYRAIGDYAQQVILGEDVPPP